MLDLAGIPKAQWPDGLDGYSLKPLMAVAGDEEVVDDRPDFIVSQFHGDNGKCNNPLRVLPKL